MFDKLLSKLVDVFAHKTSTLVPDFEAVSKVIDPDSEPAPVKKNIVSTEHARKLKLQHFTELLQHGVVTVGLDATFPGVIVPDHLKGSKSLILNYSYSYGIKDFFFDDEGVSASLSFRGVPHMCFVPWESVGMIGSQKAEIGYSYDDVKMQSQVEIVPEQPAPALTPLERRKQFKLIEGGKK